MNHAFGVGMLNGVANLGEKIQPLFCGQLMKVTKFGDGHALDQVHHEGWAPESGSWVLCLMAGFSVSF